MIIVDNAPSRAKARRAAFKFFAFSFLEGFAPIYPVYMIMFEGRGYELTSLSLLLSIWSLPVVLLELPSGILADRWSKKGVVAIGMALKALCFVLWASSPSFLAAALGFISWGCQEALCSGARQALLYEALKRESVEAEYEGIVGVSLAIELITIAFAMVAGAAIYAVSPLLALGLSSLSAAAAAAIALTFRDRSAERGTSGVHPSLLAELKECVTTKSILGLLAAACLAGAAYGTVDEFDALWAADRYSVPVAWIGAWGAVRVALQGLGGLVAGRLSGLLGKGRMGGALLAAGSLFAISAFLNGWWGIPPYFFYFFLMAALSVMFEARLQEAAEDASRASLLSLSSLHLTLVAVVLAPALGAAGDAGGMAWIIAICGGLTAMVGGFMLAFKNRSYYHMSSEGGQR